MTESIISGTVTGAIMLVIGALVTRLSLKTRTQDVLDEALMRIKRLESNFEKSSSESEKRNELILESLLAIMLELNEKGAGEKIDGALKNLNNYVIEKGAK